MISSPKKFNSHTGENLLHYIRIYCIPFSNAKKSSQNLRERKKKTTENLIKNHRRKNLL